MSWEVIGEFDKRSYMIWVNFQSFTLADEKTTDCEGDKNNSIEGQYVITILQVSLFSSTHFQIIILQKKNGKTL